MAEAREGTTTRNAMFVNANPNGRYDSGPNCAGAGRWSSDFNLVSAIAGVTGLRSDGHAAFGNVRVGLSAAGVPRVYTSATVTSLTDASDYNNAGPNAAGTDRCAIDSQTALFP